MHLRVKQTIISSTINYGILIPVLILSLGFAVGCQARDSITPEVTIPVTVQVDGEEINIQVASNTSVQSALEKANIRLNNLDKVEPPTYTELTEAETITIIRVTEEFAIDETTIPFLRQTVRNESLPEGETLLIQPGVNGIQQITYRKLFENGVETSRSVFKTETLIESKPEIIMVGVQTPFMAVPLSGKLAYLTASNAWVMENNTGNRLPILTSGDLDGRVFSLSPDGEWLLFTRKSEDNPAEQINTLWVTNLETPDPEPRYLRAENIIHFADWVPNTTRTIAYSTVEPRATAPGWQANNDLYKLAFDEDGKVVQVKEMIEPNSGGIYGWWGTIFTWSPDGKRIAYARPDNVGLVNLGEATLEPLLDIVPLQTRSDWAWVPGVNWDNDHRVIYTVIHAPKSGLTTDEVSPLFDLTAVVPDEDLIIPLVPQSGMFAYPVPSPNYARTRMYVAYLQAVFPDQSETSRYRLMIMDRDGSNRQAIFPPDGTPGMDPQQVKWAPSPALSDNDLQLAVIYQGNLWLVEPTTQEAQQITGDGSINKMDWK